MKSENRERVKESIDYINRFFIAEVFRSLYPSQQKGDVTVTTTMTVLNSLLNKNTLIEGCPGSGKTLLASVVGSMLYQIPIEIFQQRKIIGSQGASINDIYATHDIAELQKGIDKAFLYLPLFLPLLPVDEANRFSEIEQNRIREGISNDIWNYANHSWKIKDQIVIATINPEVYGGTSPLNENLLDNFSIVLWSPEYNEIAHQNLILRAEENIKEKLGLEDYVYNFIKFYEYNKNNPNDIQKKIKDLQDETKGIYDKRNIPFINYNGHNQIREEILSMKFDPEARLFFHSLTAEINYSNKYGRNRLEDPTSDSNHDKKYLSTKVRQGLRGRFFKDLDDTAKAIAWYLGKSKVGVEDVKAAFTYTAPRRIIPEEDFYQEILNKERKLPIRHEMAKVLAEMAYMNYADFAKPENQSFNVIRTALETIESQRKTNDTTNNTKETTEKIEQILKKTDHPLAKKLLEGLENTP